MPLPLATVPDTSLTVPDTAATVFSNVAIVAAVDPERVAMEVSTVAFIDKIVVAVEPDKAFTEDILAADSNNSSFSIDAIFVAFEPDKVEIADVLANASSAKSASSSANIAALSDAVDPDKVVKSLCKLVKCASV